MGIRSVVGAITIGITALVVPQGESKAATIFQNLWQNSSADCSFSSTCAQQAYGSAPYIAAQAFSLAGNTSILSASFTEWDIGIVPTSVNWAFYQVSGGLPGAIISSGSSAVAGVTNVGNYGGYSINDIYFNVAANLGAGNYFFGISAISPTFNTYLSDGVATTGAAQSTDSGAFWTPTYKGFDSIAVGLFDTSVNASAVPGPIVGAGIPGLVMALGGLLAWRRRRMAAAA